MTISRQPAQLFRHFREAHRSDKFLTIAEAGFPHNRLANERLACLRIAMLCSLDSLRMWDIGGWILSVSDRADSLIELGATGDTAAAVHGLQDSIRSLRNLEPEKYPNLATAISMLDSITSDERRDLVNFLLQSPPIAWRKTHSLLCKLSDAIPEDQLLVLADWTLKVEQSDLLRDLWVHTLMDVWNEILPFTSKGEELTVRLAPVLRCTIVDGRVWDRLHDTILAAILAAPSQLAIEFVGLLVSAESPQPHWQPYRFSIALNVLKIRPEVADQLFPYLKADLETRDDVYQRQLLKRYELKKAGKPEDQDPQFRRRLVEELKHRLTERMNLPGRSYTIGGSNFGNLAKLVSWPRSETPLVNLITQAIDADTVLYSDKFDYLVFLGELIRRGPAGQGTSIVDDALRWTEHGIDGRDIGFQGSGPLSTFQMASIGREELRNPLMYLIEQCSLRFPKKVLPKLSKWLSLNVATHIPSCVSHFLATVLALICEAGKQSHQDAAKLVALADTVAIIAGDKSIPDVLGAFQKIVLKQRLGEFSKGSVRKSAWGQALFEQWAHRLNTLSQHASADVRVNVAAIATAWKKHGLPYAGTIDDVMKRLQSDCRLRVRNALVMKNEDLG
ncbi:MAG: hypothetical protein R3C18_23490 [Planctomycetaceae bacterium]